MITITINCNDVREALRYLERLDVRDHVVTVEPINAEAPAPAREETVDEPRSVATPAASVPIVAVVSPPSAAKRGRGRPPKVAKEPAAPDVVEAKAPVPTPQPTPVAAVPEFAPEKLSFSLDEPKTAAPAAVVPPLTAVQDAIEKVLAVKGAGPAMASLSRFGVKRSRELLESQRGEFIAYCADVVAGKFDPLAGTGVA